MIFGSLGIILVSSFMIFTSYAYFTVDLKEETSDINLITFNANTDVIFNDTSNLSLVNAYTGEEIVKSFTVSNVSDFPVYYDIVFNNVVNNFSDKNYLVYDLTSTNNGAKRIVSVMPKEDTYIAKNVYIPPNSMQEYTMNIKFLARSLLSFHCQVSIIYFKPLYKIIVIDKATTKDNNNLVNFTIVEGFLLIHIS